MIKSRRIITILIIIFLARISVSVQAEEVLSIVYYYNNPCASCEVEKEFYTLFNEQVGDIKDNRNYKIQTYNIFESTAKANFEQFCKINKIEDTQVPVLAIGDEILIGQEEIEQLLREKFIQAKNAQEYILQSSSNKQEDLEATIENLTGVHLKYFYTLGCKDCIKTEKLLTTIEPIQNGEIIVQKVDINTEEGLKQLYGYFEKYKVPEKEQRVPIIFYEEGYLSSYGQIEKELPYLIREGHIGDTLVETTSSVETQKEKMNLIKVIIVGLINGLNPCAIGILLFLLSLTTINKNILSLGISYILGKIAAYLAISMVLYKSLTFLENPTLQNINKILNLILVGGLFIIALMNLIDYLQIRKQQYGKIKLQLPLKVRQFNHKLIKKVGKTFDSKYVLINVFIISVIISISEFLCTGQIYLATLLYLSKASQQAGIEIKGYLLAYILAMVIPMGVIIILITKGQKIIAVSETIRKYMPIIKLINAVVLLVLGFLTLLIIL